MSRDPATGLAQALSAHLGPLTDLEAQSTPWSSATYNGMRHVLWFAVGAGPQIETVLAALPDLDLPMTAHFVADIAVMERRVFNGAIRLCVQALTIEDR